jgi:signal transduction histidine kinase
MLELDKIAAGKMVFDMHNQDASQLFAEALSANESYLAQYGVTVVTKGLETPCDIYCDPDRMLQVLNNLLSNAAKFSSRGGEIHAALKPMANGVQISVQDFGVGIPKAAQATIFERFTQAKNGAIERRGTGLGLSIVKAIVEHHNGHVELDSAEGKGTTFHIFLPHAARSGAAGLRKAS